jgi:abhydrolase domain-containing protein 17
MLNIPLLILAIYGAFALSVAAFADRLIFLPPPVSYRHQPSEDASALNILTGDAHVIAARYLHNRASDYTILFSHGNASDIGTISPILQALYEQGFSVLAYDYPGYGHSSGRPVESSAYNAIEVAFSYLTESLGVPAEKIILYGQSLGGGPSTYLAARLARRTPVAGLILEGAFATAFQVAVPFKILPFDKFPNIRRIRHINCPLMLIHASADRTIPFSHSEALLSAAAEPKSLVAIAQADHNDILQVGKAIYLEAIREFASTLSRENNR